MSAYPFHSATLERFKGQSGYCIGYLVKASNANDDEEELLICGISDDGAITPDDFGKKLLELDVVRDERIGVPDSIRQRLNREFKASLESYEKGLSSRMQIYLNAEIDKLYAWADDNVYPLEDKVISLRKELQAVRRAAKKALSATERIEFKKKELSLSRQLNEAQTKCNSAREYYDSKSEEQIESLQKSLENAVSSKEAFILRWSLR